VTHHDSGRFPSRSSPSRTRPDHAGTARFRSWLRDPFRCSKSLSSRRRSSGNDDAVLGTCGRVRGAGRVHVSSQESGLMPAPRAERGTLGRDGIGCGVGLPHRGGNDRYRSVHRQRGASGWSLRARTPGRNGVSDSSGRSCSTGGTGLRRVKLVIVSIAPTRQANIPPVVRFIGNALAPARAEGGRCIPAASRCSRTPTAVGALPPLDRRDAGCKSRCTNETWRWPAQESHPLAESERHRQ